MSLVLAALVGLLNLVVPALTSSEATSNSPPASADEAVQGTSVATSPAPATTAAVAAPPEWFDSSGGRDGISMVDEATPWRSTPSFNLVVNNSTYSRDERTFVDGVIVGRPGPWADPLVLNPGDTLELRIFVVNEAEPALNAPPSPGVALDTRVLIGVGNHSANRGEVVGIITADNAEPGWVADTLQWSSPSEIRLEPIISSTEITSSCNEAGQLVENSESSYQVSAWDNFLVGFFDRTQIASVVGGGMKVGCGNQSGEMKAGWNYSIYVTTRFNVVAATS